MIFALSLALSAPAPVQVAAFGAGAGKCQVALASDRYQLSYSWVMGYFSGLNSGTGSTVGRTTDGDGIMAEVISACRDKPTLSLIEAVDDAYTAMQAAKR